MREKVVLLHVVLFMLHAALLFDISLDRRGHARLHGRILSAGRVELLRNQTRRTGGEYLTALNKANLVASCCCRDEWTELRNPKGNHHEKKQKRPSRVSCVMAISFR